MLKSILVALNSTAYNATKVDELRLLLSSTREQLKTLLYIKYTGVVWLEGSLYITFIESKNKLQ